MAKRYLVLENGSIYEGKAFGASNESLGEVIFTTGMTGYQEIITNPSAAGAVVVMTYPSVGNYGINRDDNESIEPAIHGIVVREYCDEPSNFRSGMSLGNYLTLKNIPGIEGIDTRQLTLELREEGSMKGYLTAEGEEINTEEVVAFVRQATLEKDLVSKVSTQKSYPSPGLGERVVLIDYGMKHSILKELNRRDCDVVVVPHDTKSETIQALFPDGILLSNGPGNPNDLSEQIDTVKELIGHYPMFGIGLGHQLLALASGAKVEKMKHGRYGVNIPVKNIATNRTDLTSQSHGYQVDPSSLVGTGLELTHYALNDESVQGLKHEEKNFFSVQFHPEGAPGPVDAVTTFGDFIRLIKKVRREGKQNA